MTRTALIIGAGPAGLTAAYELVSRTDVKPVIFEALTEVGGLARTEKFKGNRIDIGGHRFFSKSDEVMAWWLNILPLEKQNGAGDGADIVVAYQRQTRAVAASANGLDPDHADRVMLVRPRRSRILYGQHFYDYPITLSRDTVAKLGLGRMMKIGTSYLAARVRPIREEKSLEDFFINRFGRELYQTFFQSYTEKVWGLSCRDIKPDWGEQRVKGLSVSKAITHAIRGKFKRDGSLSQNGTETSLIERFLYPKLGPGQLWEEVARRVTDNGGELHMGQRIVGVDWGEGRVRAIDVLDVASGAVTTHTGDFVFSTMPIRDLITAMGVHGSVPSDVARVSQALVYRDFITVGVLLKKINHLDDALPGIPRDTWIYVQESHVKLGRIQIFNNWSPYLVNDPSTVWLGLEYFCNEGDEMWMMGDAEMRAFAEAELDKLGLAKPADVLDAVVIRVPKAYPAYYGGYEDFDTIRAFTDSFSNLFLVGRNGMHRYNNQDHSMLTAIRAVDNIVAGRADKANLWAVNVEKEYIEEKQTS